MRNRGRKKGLFILKESRITFFTFSPRFNWRSNLAVAKTSLKRESSFLALKQAQCQVRSFSPQVIYSLGILVKGSERGNGLNYGCAPTSKLPLRAVTFGGQWSQSAGPSQNQFATMDTFVEVDVSSVITTGDPKWRISSLFLHLLPHSLSHPPLYST